MNPLYPITDILTHTELKRLRLEMADHLDRHVTQAQMGRMMGYAFPDRQINAMENGKTPITLQASILARLIHAVVMQSPKP